MKKTLSLLLVLAMVLSSFSFAFAEETAKTPSAGEVLKEMGVLVGNTEDGDLMLDQEFKRQDMIVLLSRLLGKEDEAKVFEGKTTFKDVKDPYYVPFMAWAEANKLTNGVGEGLFGFGRPVTEKEVATLMVRALGYADPEWENEVAKAVELGLVAKDADLSVNCVRGTMAEIALKALSTKVKDSDKTLAETLGLEIPGPAVSENLELKSVKAIGNDKVEVKLVEDVEAVAPEAFAIVEKGTDKDLEVKDAVLESGKVVVLTTAPMTAGKAYTMTAKEVSLNFTGIAKETAAPKIKTAKVVDTNTVELTFDKVLDRASAEIAENYTINNSAVVVSAALESDRMTVTLTTENVVKGKLYTLKVAGIKSIDLVEMKAASKNFVGSVDNTAPKISKIEAKTNTRLYIDFSDDHGIDKATAENIENYAIKDLAIVSVEAVDTDDDGNYDRVEMVTEPQTVGKQYTLTIDNLADGSVSVNVGTKALSKTFRGKALDKESPTVTGTISADNNIYVTVKFADRSALDVASATDISNYEIDGLDIEKAEILDDSDLYVEDGRTVVLTTSAQDSTKTYKLTVKGVQDEFGNELKPISGSKYRTYYFKGTKVDTIPPYVKKVTSVDSKTVKIEFDGSLDKATAQDPTNYVINGGVGAAVKATLKDSRFVTLKTLEQTAGSTYKITINGVADKAGNTAANVTAKFVALSNAHDIDAPELDYIEALYKDEIRLHFNEEVKASAATMTLKSSPINAKYAGLLDDGTTVVMAVYDGTLGNDEYVVNTINGITDLAKNQYKYDSVAANAATIEFWGSDADNDAPEMTSFEQTDAKTIRVYFTEPVKVDKTKLNTLATNNPFTSATVDPDKEGTYEGMCIVDFEASSKLPVDKEYKFNFEKVITDLVGTASEEDKVEISTYIEDKDAPVLVNVEAKDNKTIVLTYDENLDSAGSYEVKYTDDKNINRRLSLDSKLTKNADKVTIKLASGELDSQYVYTLKIVVGPRDLSNNKLNAREADTFEFVGTDVRPNEAYVTGVVLESPSILSVSATEDVTVVNYVYELDDDGNKVCDLLDHATLDADGNVDQVILVKPLLLADKTYEIKVNNDENLKFTFSGLLEDNGITVKAGGEVEYYNPDASNEDVAILNENFVELGVAEKAALVADNPATEANDASVVYVLIYEKDENGVRTDKVLYGAKVEVIAK